MRAVEVDDFHSLVRVADGRCKIVSAGGDAQHTPAGGLETAGGRVLGVTAGGDNLAAAIGHAYQGVEVIHFDGAHFRGDIGRKGLERYKDSIQS